MAQTDQQPPAVHSKANETPENSTSANSSGGSAVNASRQTDTSSSTATATTGQSGQSGPPSAASETPAANLVVPTPKRFSAVNVSKKFLEKNSSAPVTTPLPLSSNSSKANGAPSRAPPPVSSSHSRLVTAKLTATSSPSTTSGQGWSRPSSVTPAPSPSGSAAASSHAASSAPQLPHVGKVIQPQPRTNAAATTLSGDGRPVWGNKSKNGATADRNSSLKNDFPTAAEAAEVQNAEAAIQAAAATAASAEQQARSAEADTFRGVHLDPNAHHWDEMEEDDDDFLNNVIQFEDGRKYNIETSASMPEPSKDSEAAVKVPASSSDGSISLRKEDRFADDFDRSWPRSQHSPPGNTDASRVLFNERSNKLEPYSNAQQRTNLGAKKGAGSETESRHSNSPTESFQVLSKHPGDKTRGEGRWRDSTGPRSQPPAHRGSTQFQDHDRGRAGPSSRNSGPPQASSTSGRPLPPHLNRMPPPPVPNQRRMSSRESRTSTQEPISPGVRTSFNQLRSPAVSHASMVLSPNASEPVALPGTSNSVSMDEARKELMTTAAARAKQRRMEEEQERERQKERAQKKAAELESRLKPTEEKPVEEAAAVAFIEDSVKDAEARPGLKPHARDATSDDHGLRRPPSYRGDPRPPTDLSRHPPARRPSASETDTWRSRVPTSGSTRSVSSGKAQALLSPASSALDHVPANADNLEVVDFSELGKFVGNDQSAGQGNSKPQRPGAQDFFEDTETPSKQPTWRRGVSATSTTHAPEGPPQPASNIHDTSAAAQGAGTRSQTVEESAEVLDDSTPQKAGPRQPRMQPPHKESTMSALDHAMSRIKGALDGMQGSHGAAKDTSASSRHPDTRNNFKPRVPFSRHPGDRHVSSTHRNHEADEDYEVFAVSSSAISYSPAGPATVDLPKLSSPPAPLPHSSQAASKFSRPAPLQWEILSWDPPVEGMRLKDLSLNNVLFPVQRDHKGKPRYRVRIPRLGNKFAFGKQRSSDVGSSWRKPVVTTSIPEALAEETIPLSSDTSQSSIELPETSSSPTSTVRSRSQPKMPAGSSVAIFRDSRIDAVDSNTTSLVTFIVNSELDSSAAPPSDPAPASPAVVPSPLASEKVASAPLPSLTPTAPPFEPAPTSKVVPMMKGTSSVPMTMKSQTSSPVINTRPLKDAHSDETVSTTPSSRNSSATWTKSPLTFSMKDSDSLAAVPEQIKAAWSQTSEKAQLPTMNSLEGIADDLTPLPFTLQDAKSEDGQSNGSGSTAPSAPVRSAFDVSKAFQQVPQSFANSTAQPTASSATSHSSTPANNGNRASSFTYPASTSSGPSRPGFTPNYHHSPMMTHSPVAAVPYPHPHPSPIPSRMNPQPVYGQPMWVPVPSPGTPAPGQMMRPMSAQYSPMMAYPPTQPVYGHPPGHPPANVVGAGRGRGAIPGSPAMSQAPHHQQAPMTPMYSGSPMMMHMPTHAPGSPAMGAPYVQHQQQHQMRPSPIPGQRPPGQHPNHAGFTPLHASWRP